jgi:hypothetical protein
VWKKQSSQVAFSDVRRPAMQYLHPVDLEHRRPIHQSGFPELAQARFPENAGTSRPGKYLQTAGVSEGGKRPACNFRSFVEGMAAE